MDTIHPENLPQDPYQEVVDELTYRNYAHNRRRSPQITPEKWALIYGDTSFMELRFQEEAR